ncbi:MAG: helix-turn-helix transcriptional regulator [Anaerolineae bacterium]|nr:helix-turn-helix transcriptional regulator [Anaerolineae bacterium]
MSLGDYLRYLRARKGGPTPWEIQEATGVPSGVYGHIEQRYREMGDEETMQKLAAYFGVPLEELMRRKPKYRKALSGALAASMAQNVPIRLILRSGDELSGRVAWWDLGATLLTLDDGSEVVVQRHIVDDWVGTAEPVEMGDEGEPAEDEDEEPASPAV